MSRDWVCRKVCDNEMHVVPDRDIVDHEPDDCMCGPRTEPMQREDGSYGWMVVHSSLDGREFRNAA